MPCLGGLGSIDTSWSHPHITNVLKGGSSASPCAFQPIILRLTYLKPTILEQIFIINLPPCGEDATSKPIRTPLPDWEVIEKEPEVDLRGILDQKKKKRERKEAFSSRSQLRCVQIQLSDGRLGYRL